MTSATKRLLCLTILCALSTCHAQDISSTLLVNFTDQSNDKAKQATAVDFATLDHTIAKTAPVNVLHGGSLYEPAIGLGLTEVIVSVSTHESSDWNTNKGHFKDSPILDSYIHSNKEKPLIESISIEGFDDIKAGQIVTLTVWGVGDVDGADTDIAIEYNGQKTEALKTEYTPADIRLAAVQFAFRKAEDVNEVTIKWGRQAHATVAAGIAGFSMTTTGSSYYTQN